MYIELFDKMSNQSRSIIRICKNKSNTLDLVYDKKKENQTQKTNKPIIMKLKMSLRVLQPFSGVTGGWVWWWLRAGGTVPLRDFPPGNVWRLIGKRKEENEQKWKNDEIK